MLWISNYFNHYFNEVFFLKFIFQSIEIKYFQRYFLYETILTVLFVVIGWYFNYLEGLYYIYVL